MKRKILSERVGAILGAVVLLCIVFFYVVVPERNAWDVARRVSTKQIYLQYLDSYPISFNSGEARRRIDDIDWNAATNVITNTSLQLYLMEHPEGRHVDEARELIGASGKEPASISDLLAQDHIEIKCRGKDITLVVMEFRSDRDRNLLFEIPIGTVFVCQDSSAQNMIVTGRLLLLARKEWHEVEVPVACANRLKVVPGDAHRFNVVAFSDNKELVSLMRVLRHESDPAIIQAAVWIITDDASLTELEEYRTIYLSRVSEFEYRGRALIGVDAAGKAMQICERAGIDITSKAIWKDRNWIRTVASNKSIIEWIEARERTLVK